uniref:Uncharacterized protein n=1 Tax=Anguilla anguilla TaxID=7936 RepID=A0A0E9WKZ9_ANGAN
MKLGSPGHNPRSYNMFNFTSLTETLFKYWSNSLREFTHAKSTKQ